VAAFQNTAPYFKSSLKDQTVYALQKLSYTLPSIIDDQNDAYSQVIVYLNTNSFLKL
jgi:hypothetical protein